MCNGLSGLHIQEDYIKKDGFSRLFICILSQFPCVRMDQICKTDQSADQQPWHTPATRTVKQN